MGMPYATGDSEKINAFIRDLRDVMEKHNVWFDVMECGMNVDYPVLTFNCESDINDPENSETEWFCEMVDMWPQEYDLVVT